MYSPNIVNARIALCLVGLAAGGALWLLGLHDPAQWAWASVTALALVPLVIEMARDLRRRKMGVDAIALLAMGGALALGQFLAGAVIGLMLASGAALEKYASSRAGHELSALLSRAPRQVHRYADGELATVPVDDVLVGDRLLVKPGEVVPVDGLVVGAGAVLDESALTGEPRPVERSRSDQVRSGTVNAGSAFDLRAIATAENSTYSGVVRLVRHAQSEKAPFVRLADRYALVFLPLTLAVAGAAWLASGSAVRALAVLVVATPCPLILAVPVAIVSGISRAANRGVIVKDGGALETLARGRILLFDKTGTLTAGTPRLAEIAVLGNLAPEVVLRLAASLDQVSAHVLAASIVRTSRDRGLVLSFPDQVLERAGAGIQGLVEGHRVRLGSAEWAANGAALPPKVGDIRRRTALEGASNVFVSVDGELTGALVLDDPIRPETPRAIRGLRRAGIRRIAMVTGDHPEVADTIGTAIGVDRVFAERSPEDKVEAVRAERKDGVTIMVGDGINDAPALAAADVGVAMGARGATASSEAADVVVMVDRLDRLVTAVRVAGRSRRIAVQSVVAGMSLSLGAMVAAAFGLIAPVGGALLQEAIDVAVILNSLRALGGDGTRQRPRAGEAEMGERFRAEHRTLLPRIEDIREVADRLGMVDGRRAISELREIRAFLAEELLPHEREEESSLYPAVGRLMGGDDPMGVMSRAHMEIRHQARLLDRLVASLPDSGPSAEDLSELRRVLYGLYAVLRLHFAQEEEAYLSLVDQAS